MDKQLVSVGVVTYRAAAFIVETLESVKAQTWENIELIISDDCSPDNTLELCREWLENNKQRFTRTEIISVPKNTGVAANCNRCIKASQSDWIKFVAGDDILLPNCIEENMAFVNKNPYVRIVFSQVKMYQDDFQEKNYLRTTPVNYPDNLMHSDLSAYDQYELLLVNDRIHYTPSYFFNKQALLEVGLYDEAARFIEDYPMWLKLTRSGERLYYFHKPTAGYRMHSMANNNVGDSTLFRPSVINDFKLRKALTHPFLPWEMVKSDEFIYWVSVFFKKLGRNKNTKSNRMLYQLMSVYGNPFHYIHAIKKRMPAYKNHLFYQ